MKLLSFSRALVAVSCVGAGLLFVGCGPSNGGVTGTPSSTSPMNTGGQVGSGGTSGATTSGSTNTSVAGNSNAVTGGANGTGTGTGGAANTSTGGSNANPTGGASSTGGKASTSTGGKASTSTGGNASTSTGGTGNVSTGGATSASAGGTDAVGGGTAAAGGTDATGGTSAAGGPKIGVAGVVVATDDAGTLGCVQLCDGTEPSEPDVNPDWGYEDGASCIIKNTTTADANQSCVTGDPLPTPDRNGLPGVVIVVDDTTDPKTLGCKPLCTKVTTPSSADAPDWGYEYTASCVLPGTTTGNCNQSCITGEPVPDASLIPARDGVLIDDVCKPFCACDSASDPEYPDWGWEYQMNCVMPNSDTTSGKLACSTDETQSYVPPALTGTTKAGFYTQSGKLYDAFGKEFVMRGVNNPHVWYDSGNQYLAYRALDTIAGYKTNTIRVVWMTKIDDGNGGKVAPSTTLLARVLYRIVQLKMVPMIELHDATKDSDNSSAKLTSMVNYYLLTDVKKVLNDFRAYLLINIANEWSGSDFSNQYSTAIKALRNGGINHTLVIDADGSGQNATTLFNNATTLTNADTQKNVLFSVHMYSQYGSASQVDAVLDKAISSSVPLVVGEFGPSLQGQAVAWQEITSKCQQNKIGYIAWSWKGNDSTNAQLDMAKDWPGPLTSWGQDIMVDNTNSIQRTASPATIFQ